MENAMRIFDADSHMIEPPLLWLERLDQKMRNRAPRVGKGPDGKKGTFFLCEDSPPLRMAPLYAAGPTPDKSLLPPRLDNCPPRRRGAARRPEVHRSERGSRT